MRRKSRKACSEVASAVERADLNCLLWTIHRLATVQAAANHRRMEAAWAKSNYSLVKGRQDSEVALANVVGTDAAFVLIDAPFQDKAPHKEAFPSFLLYHRID
jgi:hypothetical protein